jgi:hypothetical protein
MCLLAISELRFKLSVNLQYHCVHFDFNLQLFCAIKFVLCVLESNNAPGFMNVLFTDNHICLKCRRQQQIGIMLVAKYTPCLNCYRECMYLSLFP